MTRRGFTLVELVVVLLVGGIVAAAVGGVLRRQQRFFTNAASLVEQRVSLRDATGILPGELRALAPDGGDVLALSDSALELRATVGAGVACDTVPGGGAIDLAPARGTNATSLSAYSTSPQAGDVALVYDAGATDRAADDGWIALDVAAVASLASVCDGSPLIDPVADAGATRVRLNFSGARVPASVRPGAFVRVLRRIRYRFYRAGSGDWYLGYSEWDGVGFGVVQPVSGPFAAYSRSGASGLMLRYFDDSGAEVLSATEAARIARIEVVARGRAGAGLSDNARAYVDSQAVFVRVRNR